MYVCMYIYVHTYTYIHIVIIVIISTLISQPTQHDVESTSPRPEEYHVPGADVVLSLIMDASKLFALLLLLLLLLVVVLLLLLLLVVVAV